MNILIFTSAILVGLSFISAGVIDKLEADWLEEKCNYERMKASGPGHDWSKFVEENKSTTLALLKIFLAVTSVTLLILVLTTKIQ